MAGEGQDDLGLVRVVDLDPLVLDLDPLVLVVNDLDPPLLNL